MNFMWSRRPSLVEVLQRTYDEAYQASVTAILKETHDKDEQAALQSWKQTLQIISSGLADVESSRHPPRTPQEQSYMSSILDIERQCHDRISYLEYRKYNKSPYYGFLPPTQQSSSPNLIDFDSFDSVNEVNTAALEPLQKPVPPPKEDVEHKHSLSNPVEFKSESALKPPAPKTGSDETLKSRSTTSFEHEPKMLRSLRTAKPGKISNGTKQPAANQAATLAWNPSRPQVTPQASSSSLGSSRLMKGRQGGFSKVHNEVDLRKAAASNASPKREPAPPSPKREPPLINVGEPEQKEPKEKVSVQRMTTTYAANQARRRPLAQQQTPPKPLVQQQTPPNQAPKQAPKPASASASASESAPASKPPSKAAPKPPPKPKALSPKPPSPEPAKEPEKVLVDDDKDKEEQHTSGNPEWDKRCKEVMKNLKGVDKNAAQQILNEIVVKGDEVHWDDIAGLEQAKGSLKETVVYPFLRPDLFSGLREPARGMLLFGPPGTGKTMLARAVATESHSTFFSISASSLTSKFLGESEKLVRALFYLAKEFAPSIIFVDEIDSLLSTRGDGGSEHEASRRIKTEFLVQWSDLQRAAAGREGGEDVQRVLVLAATNLPWTIDEAARRRFVRRQYIPLPERETRFYQLQQLLSHQKHALTKNDMMQLLQMTDGFSGSDITALAKDAAMGPLRSLGDALLTTARESIRPIRLEDFEASLKFIRPSVSKEGLAQFEEWAAMYGSSGA